MEYWITGSSITAALQHSTTPILHHSNTPLPPSSWLPCPLPKKRLLFAQLLAALPQSHAPRRYRAEVLVCVTRQVEHSPMAEPPTALHRLFQHNLFRPPD